MAEVFVPDPLMRFSPTPFDWTVSHAGCTIRIESNDLGIALGLWQAWAGPGGKRMVRSVAHARLVVDRGHGYGGLGPRHQGAGLQIENGSLRTLLHGAGTVLFYDAERRELLGFLSPDITVEDLLEQFVPALVEGTPVLIERMQSMQ